MKKNFSLLLLSALYIYPSYGSGGIEMQSMPNANPASNNTSPTPENDIEEKKALMKDLRDQLTDKKFTYSQKYGDISNTPSQIQSFQNGLDKLVALAAPDPQKTLGIFRIFSQQLIDYILKDPDIAQYRKTNYEQKTKSGTKQPSFFEYINDPNSKKAERPGQTVDFNKQQALDMDFLVTMIKDLLTKLTYKAVLKNDPLQSLSQEQKAQLFQFIYAFSIKNTVNDTIPAKSFFLDTENRLIDRLQAEYLGWIQVQKKTQNSQSAISQEVLKQQVQEVKSTDPKGWLKEKLYWTFQQIKDYKQIANDYQDAQQKIAKATGGDLVKQQEAAALKTAKYNQFSDTMKILLDNSSNDKELGIANIFTPQLSDLIMSRLTKLTNPAKKLDYQTVGNQLPLDNDTQALINALKALMGTIEIKYPAPPQIKRFAEFLYVFSFLNPQNDTTENFQKQDARKSFFQDIEDQFKNKLPAVLSLNYWKDERNGLYLREQVNESDDPLVATISHHIPTEEYFKRLFETEIAFDRNEQAFTIYPSFPLMSILNKDFIKTLAQAYVDEVIQGKEGVAHQVIGIIDGRCTSAERTSLQDIVWSGIQQIHKLSTKEYLKSVANRLSTGSKKAEQFLDEHKKKRRRDKTDVLDDSNIWKRMSIDGLEKVWLAWQGMVYFHMVDLPIPLESLIGKGTLGVKELISAKWPWKYAGTWPDFYLNQPTFKLSLDLYHKNAFADGADKTQITRVESIAKTDAEIRKEIENFARPKLKYFQISLTTEPEPGNPEFNLFLVKTQSKIITSLQEFYQSVIEECTKRGADPKLVDAKPILDALALLTKKRASLIALYSGILGKLSQPNQLAEDNTSTKAALGTYEKGDFMVPLANVFSRTFLSVLENFKRQIAVYQSKQAGAQGDLVSQEFSIQLADKGSEIFQNIEQDLAQLRTEVFPVQETLIQKTDQTSAPDKPVVEQPQQQDQITTVDAAPQQAAQIAQQQKALAEIQQQQDLKQALRKNFQEGLQKAQPIAEKALAEQKATAEQQNNETLKPLPQGITAGVN